MALTFFEFQLKGGIVVAIAVLIYVLLLANDSFFHRNRVWLLSSLFIPWIVPLMAMPGWVKGLLFGAEEKVNNTALLLMADHSNQISVTEVAGSSFSWELAGLCFYIFISCVLLIRLIWGYRYINRLKQQAETKTYKGYRVVVLPDEQMSPFSFFRTICIPKGLEKRDDKSLILEHEKLHCAQWHSVDLSLSEWLLIIHWWNPFAWWLRKLIAQNHEFCVDNAMLKQTSEPKSYQYSLVNLLPGGKRLQLVNNFNQSLTKKRIVMMNKANTNRYIGWLKGILVMPLIALILLAFTNPDKTMNDDLKKDKVEAIKNMQELRSYIARHVKYPIEARKSKQEGEVVAHFLINQKGQPDKPVLGKATGDNVVVVDELMVVGYDVVGKTSKNITNEPGKSNKLFDKEVYRMLEGLPAFVDQNLMGKTLEVKLSFRLLEKENSKHPIYYLDGEQVSAKIIGLMDPDKIESMVHLNKDVAVKNYGDKASDGVIRVVTKSRVHNKNGFIINKDVNEDSPLYIVDGVEMDDISEIDPNNIQYINVLKDKKAVELYGKKGKNGVIVVSLKKKSTVSNAKPLIDENGDFSYMATDSVITNTDQMELFGNQIDLSGMPREKQPLYFIGDKEITSADMEALNVNDIKFVTVLKDESAVEKYGERAKNGVVIIEVKASGEEIKYF
ncbi:hypothetical protein DMA11_11090 [Marinilabiliaceae bacterium JC017]|nr:hypothetical protein DMA11_11090 [Marinilabiliaceae bacterium JC017]